MSTAGRDPAETVLAKTDFGMGCEIKMKNRWGTGVLVLTFLLAALALPGSAAFRTASGDNVVIEKSETVQGDLYSGAANTIIDGTITGDLVVAGDNITVNGRVGGSILAAGGNLTVNGPVGANIRAATGSLIVNSTVGGNVTAAGSSILFGPDSVVRGALLTWAGSLETRGGVGDEVRVGAGRVALGGKVGGEVRAYADRVSVLPGAEVTGRLLYYSPTQAHIPDSARIGGGVEYEPVQRREMVNWHRVARALQAGWFAGVILLGVLLWLIYPARLQGLTLPVASTWTRGFLTGLVALVAAPVAMAVFAATLIGIPVALALFGLYLFGMLLTLPLAGALAARQVQAKWFPDSPVHPALLALAGMAGIALLRLTPVVGPLVTILSFVLGYGLFVQLLTPAR